jgi:hypothetical protein
LVESPRFAGAMASRDPLAYYQRLAGVKQVLGAKGGAHVVEVAYTVAVAFERPELAEEWLRWLLPGHVAEVLRGGATQAEVVELDGTADPLRCVSGSRRARRSHSTRKSTRLGSAPRGRCSSPPNRV